jgi:hypothetical protein
MHVYVLAQPSERPVTVQQGTGFFLSDFGHDLQLLTRSISSCDVILTLECSAMFQASFIADEDTIHRCGAPP